MPAAFPNRPAAGRAVSVRPRPAGRPARPCPPLCPRHAAEASPCSTASRRPLKSNELTAFSIASRTSSALDFEDAIGVLSALGASFAFGLSAILSQAPRTRPPPRQPTSTRHPTGRLASRLAPATGPPSRQPAHPSPIRRPTGAHLSATLPSAPVGARPAPRRRRRGSHPARILRQPAARAARAPSGATRAPVSAVSLIMLRYAHGAATSAPGVLLL